MLTALLRPVAAPRAWACAPWTTCMSWLVPSARSRPGCTPTREQIGGLREDFKRVSGDLARISEIASDLVERGAGLREVAQRLERRGERIEARAGR